MLLTMVQPEITTFSISNAAMAPPHVEHGCVATAGQLPVAELPENVLFWTLSTKSLPGPDTDIAPPLAALQLTKAQNEMDTLLPTADTAPPLEFASTQFRKVTPVMVTEEFMMLRAAPDNALRFERRLQSNIVSAGPRAPRMASDGMPLMLIVVSLNTPALRFTVEARSC